jgi:hypothetical protein
MTRSRALFIKLLELFFQINHLQIAWHHLQEQGWLSSENSEKPPSEASGIYDHVP